FAAGGRPPLIYWTSYGLLLGTNSLGVPLPAPLAPSLAVFLSRAGILELNAYLLAATATAGWARRIRGPVQQVPADQGAGVEVPSALRTAGATFVPNNSMERSTSRWGRVPTVICSKKRSCWKISCW